jgi:hypothetical protein
VQQPRVSPKDLKTAQALYACNAICQRFEDGYRRLFANVKKFNRKLGHSGNPTKVPVMA